MLVTCFLAPSIAGWCGTLPVAQFMRPMSQTRVERCCLIFIGAVGMKNCAISFAFLCLCCPRCALHLVILVLPLMIFQRLGGTTAYHFRVFQRAFLLLALRAINKLRCSASVARRPARQKILMALVAFCSCIPAVNALHRTTALFLLSLQPSLTVPAWLMRLKEASLWRARLFSGFVMP